MANAQRLSIMIAIILFFGAGVYLIAGGVYHGGYREHSGWHFDELEIAFGFILVKVSSLINAEYKRHEEKTSL